MAKIDGIILRTIYEIILEFTLNAKSFNEHGPAKKKILRTLTNGEL
jgi:hypothetical protein